ncbi:MAG: sulfatase-like hydrolase/transferase [Planctomycetes bacterium]|nr:sulfatase-like hydrolase/transferase [Planctomycetota bacterium]
MSRPNVVVVVVDCARSDKWLGPGRPVQTPNLDRLAAQSVVLPTAIVEKSCTTPSFSTLLTGRYSPRHGVHLVWGYRLPASVPMLTEQFAAHGYRTVAEVTGPLLAEMGLARGFHEYQYRAPCDLLNTKWGDQFVERLRGGTYHSPFFLLLHLWELHPHRCVPAEFDRPEFGRDSYERAISALDAQLARLLAALPKPTLLVFTGDHGEKTTFESYAPNTAVDYSRRMLGVDEADGMAPYEIAGWAGPSVLQELYGRSTPMMRSLRIRDWRRPRFSRLARWRDRLRLLRLTPFVYLHDLLALRAPLALTAMLKRRGLLDASRARGKVERFSRSLDQNALLDMHMRMWINSYKRNMHEGHMVHVYDFLTKVPLVFHWIGADPPAALSRPRVIDRMVRQPDILPTIADLVGLGAPAASGIDGRSLRALLEGRPWEPLPAYLSVSGLPMDLELRGVRTESHRFTYGPHNPELPAELYDLTADPHESNNLAARHPDRCAELRRLADEMAGDESAPVEEMVLSPEEQSDVEARLRSLGYIE